MSALLWCRPLKVAEAILLEVDAITALKFKLRRAHYFIDDAVVKSLVNSLA